MQEEDKVKQLISKIKDNDQDYEFYPTTVEIISIINNDIKSMSPSKIESSILDIGAGNGNFFRVLESFQPPPKDQYDSSRMLFTKYAIEKSAVLIENMEPDIFIVGTDFHQQTLIDKKVDIIFCNPPYSEFDIWAEKIITEANCRIIYMVIPERWKNNKKIIEMLERRNMDYKIIGNTDFLDSEYRQARAKVDIIRFKGKMENYSGRSYESEKEDPFNIWFDSFFKIEAEEVKDKYRTSYDKEKEKREHIKSSIIKGQNLIERLEELYQTDFENMLNNYRAIEKLDKEIFKELGVDLNNLKGGLKLKIEGLKNLYWKELFDNLDTITARLTKDSREKLLKKLTEHTSVDFTSGNAYAVVMWAIKNANIYLDEQLKAVYLWMTRAENVQNYKSNQTFLKDDWRYCREHTHYTLDYRLVFHCYSNFGGYSYEKHNNLSRLTHDYINDIITIGKNLGFNISLSSYDYEWSPGKAVKFMVGDKVFAEIRAYINGNIHCKFDQKFIKKLNIEAGRLNGWIKSPEQAAEEMNIPLNEVKELYGKNLKIAVNNVLLIA